MTPSRGECEGWCRRFGTAVRRSGWDFMEGREGGRRRGRGNGDGERRGGAEERRGQRMRPRERLSRVVSSLGARQGKKEGGGTGLVVVFFLWKHERLYIYFFGEKKTCTRGSLLKFLLPNSIFIST